MASITIPLQLSPPPLHLTRFPPDLFVALKEILFQPSFALINLLQKITHFQSKEKKSFILMLLDFDFIVLCVFFRVLFHSSSIMKLWIASYLDICIVSYWTYHQIMWHTKRIHDHGLKITSCCCFFGFRGN